jgi:glycosyltransferase involved in cell wall biosynthesis
MSKIAFVYAYEKEEWSTPMALAREFESRGWEVEYISIGSNSTSVYTDVDLHSWIINPAKTADIVLYMDWGRFDALSLDKDRKPESFWVQESGDDPQNFERNFPKASRFHMTLSPDYQSTEEYKKRGIDAHWWTHFADTRVQFPMEVEPEFVGVTSRGPGGSEFLDTLTKHSQGAFGNKRDMGPEEHTKFLNSGLMVVQNSRWGEITRRIFEGMACGKLVLTDRLKADKMLEKLFIEGQEIVFYDDIVDCINKMNFFATHETEREGIAKRGMKKVLENHTQKQRVDFILKKYQQWKNKQYQEVN